MVHRMRRYPKRLFIDEACRCFTPIYSLGSFIALWISLRENNADMQWTISARAYVVIHVVLRTGDLHCSFQVSDSYRSYLPCSMHAAPLLLSLCAKWWEDGESGWGFPLLFDMFGWKRTVLFMLWDPFCEFYGSFLCWCSSNFERRKKALATHLRTKKLSTRFLFTYWTCPYRETKALLTTIILHINKMKNKNDHSSLYFVYT